MTAKEYFEELCQQYPITIEWKKVKKFTNAQWQKAQKQFDEFYRLERMVKQEKQEQKKFNFFK